MRNIKKTDVRERSKFPVKRNISPAQAVNILKKNNVEISEGDAEKILDILYLFAKIGVDQNLQKIKDRHAEEK